MSGAYDFTPAPKARRLALLTTLITAFLCVLSQMGLNTENQTLPFLMLPTLAIYLWPSGANPVLSLIGIFIVGLFQDYLSFGPAGLWPITWLALFLILRPDVREKSALFLFHWIGACVVLICVGLFQLALARFVLRAPIDLPALGLSVLMALIIFPPFYFIRDYFARSFGNREDYFYEGPAR